MKSPFLAGLGFFTENNRVFRLALMGLYLYLFPYGKFSVEKPAQPIEE
jgi:hypothetical protein